MRDPKSWLKPMGRKRKRKRRARKAESEEERAELEMAGEEVEEEVVDDEDEYSTANPPPAAVDECEEEEEEETIEGLLEPFSRDELLDLLAEACIRDPALLSRLSASAASDAAHRRLFVHGLGPCATTAALAAAFAPFGALDECHAVDDRATGRCRGYGFVTFRCRSAARRALADASKRVGGRPVACQLASLGPAGPSPDRKLFVDNVPARAAHDELRGLFSRFGEIEEGPLGADRVTGQFRGYAIFLYKSPEGLTKALEEPKKVFNGCELHCHRAHRVIKKKHVAAATPEDAGGQSNGAGAAALPTVQLKELPLTSATQPLLGSNPPVGLMAKGISSATVLSCRNAGSGGAGLLGASPSTTVVPSSPGQSTPSSQPGAVKSSRLFSMGASTSTSQAGEGSTRPGLIQRYLGR